MGLDIYAGTLTRYFTRNWKTHVQKMAEIKGYKFCLYHPKVAIKPIEDPAQIREIHHALCQWRDELGSTIQPNLPAPLWDEDTDEEYFTDKPGWLAYSALVFLQACRYMKRDLPEYVDEDVILQKDPIYEEAKKCDFPSSLLHEVELWIPYDDNFICGPLCFVSSEDEEGFYASTLKFLQEELEDLNRNRWNADEATILSWRNDKYYVPAKYKDSRSFVAKVFFRRPKHKTPLYRTEDLAQCAFSILWCAVHYAKDHKVPLILDY